MNSQPYSFQSRDLFPDPLEEQEKRVNKKRKTADRSVAEEEILVFGYECKIFRDVTLANRIEGERHLLACKTDSSGIVWMDRFDVRHWLDMNEFVEDLKKYDKARIDKEELDKSRYLDLFNVEDQDSTADEWNAIEKEIIRKYKTPANMIIPSTQQQLVIIEDIVNQINSATSKNANLLEIKIQVKNSMNPYYNFLNKQDPLYNFYKHIIWIFKSGLGSYSSSSEQDD